MFHSLKVELSDLQGICRSFYIETMVQVMPTYSFALVSLWSAFLGLRLMQSQASAYQLRYTANTSYTGY